MPEQPTDSIPPYVRLAAVGLVVASAVGMLLNHFAGEIQSTARLMLLAISPIGFFLGLGGVVEPRILWALGKHGQHLPVIYKIIGGILGVVGLVVTLLLVFFVYPLAPQR